jgi:hypothetical protein
MSERFGLLRVIVKANAPALLCALRIRIASFPPFDSDFLPSANAAQTLSAYTVSTPTFGWIDGTERSVPMPRLERFSLLAGAIAALLWTLALVLLEASGNPVSPDSGAVIAEYFVDNAGIILAAGTASVIGTFFFLWFVAGLYSNLTKQADDHSRLLTIVMLVGGTAGAALMLGMLGPQMTAATSDAHLVTADVAIVMWRMAHAFFVGAATAFSVFMVAMGLLALRGALLPAWLGYAALVIAVVLLAGPIAFIGMLVLFPLWLLRGRANLKAQIARRVTLNVSRLP